MFKNRLDAGERLANLISENGVVFDFLFACPRGGVEVAFPIAKQFKKEIIPLFSHKIPSSINEEFAIGAVSIDGEYIINEYGKSEPGEYLEEIIRKTVDLLKKRKDGYGVSFDFTSIKDKIVLIVDDGIATGETLFVGVKSILKHKPKEIYVAVPVSSYEGYLKLSEISKVIALHIDKYFFAVSQYYDEFSQLSDDEVKKYLALSKEFSKIQKIDGTFL
ncbi:phosphoribosyltransferase [Caldisericum exile]|uniref:phosphoribosyltransferase n=1 Tax=Caldisericum exile TaxID=693075 RepID=UPI003C74F579